MTVVYQPSVCNATKVAQCLQEPYVIEGGRIRAVEVLQEISFYGRVLDIVCFADSREAAKDGKSKQKARGVHIDRQIPGGDRRTQWNAAKSSRAISFSRCGGCSLLRSECNSTPHGMENQVSERCQTVTCLPLCEVYRNDAPRYPRGESPLKAESLQWWLELWF